MIAHVHPRSEKTVARLCQSRQTGHVLPLLEKKTRRSDTNQVRASTVPLFPGYIAFSLRNDGKQSMLETGKVVQLLEVHDQEQFVFDLHQLVAIADSQTDILGTNPFVTGMRVRVLDGPFQGMVGIVENQLSRRRLLIQVEAFQTSVSVSLEHEDVEPV